MEKATGRDGRDGTSGDSSGGQQTKPEARDPALSKWFIRVYLPMYPQKTCFLLKLEMLFSNPELKIIIIPYRSLRLNIFKT